MRGATLFVPLASPCSSTHSPRQIFSPWAVFCAPTSFCASLLALPPCRGLLASAAMLCCVAVLGGGRTLSFHLYMENAAL